VWRKYRPEQYRGWNEAKRTISFCLVDATGPHEHTVSLKLEKETRRFNPREEAEPRRPKARPAPVIPPTFAELDAAQNEYNAARDELREAKDLLEDRNAAILRMQDALSVVGLPDDDHRRLTAEKQADETARDQLRQAILGLVLEEKEAQSQLTALNNRANPAPNPPDEVEEETGDEEVAPHNYILPLMPCAVAIPDGGPLPREYLEFTDEDNRRRLGFFVYVGTNMRPSYVTAPKAPLKIEELTPLMDMRCVNSRDVLHVRLDPDDSYHTVM
jgi:hypothetical protein